MKEIKATLGALPSFGASLKNITVNQSVKITSHEELEGRDLPDQHPADSITGLRELMESLLGEAKESGEFDGKNGKSAYETALEGGFSGSEEAFAEMLANGAPGSFYVTISDDGTTVDKTDEEIAAAFESGAPIYAIFPFDGLPVLMPLISAIPPELAGNYIWVFSLNAADFTSDGVLCASVIVSSGSVVSVSGNELASLDDIPEIPSSLRNPYGINFTGAVSAYYDGSSPQTVHIPAIPEALKNPEKLTIDGTEYDGSAAVALYTGSGKSVKAYGAAGDGVTDDTAAFKSALAENRTVFVPEGTYILSDTLTVGANCSLELSQATVLKFTQTDKNCISLLRLASLKGNHATIFVPYTFSANVINCDTRDDDAALDPNDAANSNAVAVPPFIKWDPQWKMSRYVSDINICKRDSNGQFHYSDDGKCYGTAVWMGCYSGQAGFMWGVSMSGVRIAGGFAYGIRGFCDSNRWNHDMRIEAVIDACEIAVSMENTNYARLYVTVQPRTAKNGTVYAKHGIKLINAKGTDLSSSRVWDWDASHSLWSEGGEYQHIAMIGECKGLILDDFRYHSTSDPRSLIYTDSISNLENMTLLQEPITKWFKPIEGVPYFSDGYSEKQLMTIEDLENHFDTNIVKSFTDVLATAIDDDGSVYNGVGYKKNVRINSDGSLAESGYYVTTGFIPCSQGADIYAHDMSFAQGDDFCRVLFYDKDFNLIYYGDDNSSPLLVNRGLLISNGNTFVAEYTQLDNGFKLTLNGGQYSPHTNTAYARFVIYKNQLGINPMISVNEEIAYTVEGFLANGINVKGENILLSSESGKAFRLTVNEDGVLSTVPIE